MVSTRLKAWTVAKCLVAYFIRRRLHIIIVAVALRIGVNISTIIKLSREEDVCVSSRCVPRLNETMRAVDI